MNNFWRQRVRHTWIGLGQIFFGASIMRSGISNAQLSIWAIPQYAFGGTMLTQGLLHLSAAWDFQPPADDRPPQGNGNARVGIPPAPIEQVPDLAAEGLILHGNVPPIADPALGGRNSDVDEEDPENAEEVKTENVVGEEGQANFADEVSQANFVGEGQANVGQEAVPEIIGDEADQEIDDSEVDSANALKEVGQANYAEESGQVSNAGDLGQDSDESEAANAVNESGLATDVGEADPANVAGQATNIGEVNQADSLDDIAKGADKDDSTDMFESEIELSRSYIGLALDVPSIKFIDSSESDCESSY